MSKIAVSVFICQNDANTVSIRSLSADDAVSKSLEKMLRESATHVLQYIQASVDCAESISQHRPVDGPKTAGGGNQVEPV